MKVNAMVCYSSSTVKYCRQNKIVDSQNEGERPVCYSISAVKYCRQNRMWNHKD